MPTDAAFLAGDASGRCSRSLGSRVGVCAVVVRNASPHGSASKPHPTFGNRSEPLTVFCCARTDSGPTRCGWVVTCLDASNASHQIPQRVVAIPCYGFPVLRPNPLDFGIFVLPNAPTPRMSNRVKSRFASS
jgi:hypothetical protein